MLGRTPSHMLGSSLAALVAVSFVALGVGAFAAPRTLGDNYGLPVNDETGLAYVRALGARDGVLGLLVAWSLAARERRALEATIACSTLLACCDFGIVFAARGGAARNGLAIHASGIAGLLVLFGALRSGR